jgi:hypothetical protein
MERKATDEEIREFKRCLEEAGFVRSTLYSGVAYSREYNYGSVTVQLKSMASGRGFKNAEAYFSFIIFNDYNRRVPKYIPLGKSTRCPDTGWLHRIQKYAALVDGAVSRFTDELAAISKESAK